MPIAALRPCQGLHAVGRLRVTERGVWVVMVQVMVQGLDVGLAFDVVWAMEL